MAISLRTEICLASLCTSDIKPRPGTLSGTVHHRMDKRCRTGSGRCQLFLKTQACTLSKEMNQEPEAQSTRGTHLFSAYCMLIINDLYVSSDLDLTTSSTKGCTVSPDLLIEKTKVQNYVWLSWWLMSPSESMPCSFLFLSIHHTH